MDVTAATLPALPDQCCWEVMQRMELATFLRSRQVCKTWHAIGEDEALWRAQALARYPASTVYLGKVYKTYKCTLDQCTSEKQTPGHPDRCVVSKLERCQQTGTVRLHFEAHSTQRPEHSALALALPSERGGVTALDDVIMTQQASWCELHTDQDGLYKGCLVWRNLAGIVDLLQRGPPRDHFVTCEQSSLIARGSQLMFCYASPLPVFCDFSPARLMTLRPGQTLHKAMVELGARFVEPSTAFE